MRPEEPGLLEALYCHIVLPPQLPQKADGDNVAVIQALGNRLHEAISVLCGVGETKVWDSLEACLRVSKSLNRSFLSRDDLLEAFDLLKQDNDATWLALHVVKQNAALLVHRDSSGDKIIFEAFQTAAPVADVLNAHHALDWEFPGRSVAITLADFSDGSFLKNLSTFLEQVSSEPYDRFSARARKGGRSVVESRDCANPALISDMLMSLLEGIGGPNIVRQVRKKIRDDVVLDASELPWRRCPYWLVLRVTMARLLSTLLEDTDELIGRIYYKFTLCAMMANLLKDSVGHLSPEKILCLQAKLCRRLAKLEAERTASSGPVRSIFDEFFAATEAFFGTIVKDVKQQVLALWDEHKRRTVRRIPPLQRRASDKDQTLILTNSLSYLRGLLTQEADSRPVRDGSLSLPSLGEGSVVQVSRLADKYTALIDYANAMSDPEGTTEESSREACIRLSQNIQGYLAKTGDAYTGNAVLMSQYLLRLFELWVAMDKVAATECPTLLQYHPVFVPDALDVLCLPTVGEMERLGHVQRYIHNRIKSCTTERTIFSDSKDRMAFPIRFMSSNQGDQMTALAKQIDAASERSRSQTKRDLTRLMCEYEDLTESIDDLRCTCTRLSDGSKDIRGCKRCWKWRRRNRLKSSVHEDFLPGEKGDQSQAHRATVLLELTCPGYLTAYRVATWQLWMLGSRAPSRSPGKPVLLFDEIANLWSFTSANTVSKSSITLASRKKSFRQTHYSTVRLPTTEVEVLVPFGPDLNYYDTKTRLWASQLSRTPSFQHTLGTWLPQSIQAPTDDLEQPRPEHGVYQPSSYNIASSEPNCPSEISVHEFSAFKRAVSARGRRWPVLLVELASTNLNFSSETTMALYNHLALQAGPIEFETGVLREAHVVFCDEAFCKRLHEQLSNRLDAMASSVREVQCMSIVVTLSLRLYRLCSQQFKSTASQLLSKIRHITSGWIGRLRGEIRSACDGEVVLRASSFAVWAALLCRQTFTIYLEAPSQDVVLSKEDLAFYFEAAIAMQESLLVDLDELNPVLKNMFINDLSVSYLMRDLIKGWFTSNPSVLEGAINETWSDEGRANRRCYSSWKILSGSCAWWATARTNATEWTARQTVHYHLLQGHLIVDGKPLGRLPLEMTSDPSIRELFGGLHLLTRPSGNLEYQLVSPFMQHNIHLGIRNGKLVIRAFFRGSALEYVPRGVFSGPDGSDLPSGLVEECVHWLNLKTGMLEIRRKPDIWKQKPGHWLLDVQKRIATRNTGKVTSSGKKSSGVCLVEPRSSVGMNIARIFQGFEDIDKLTVYQPVEKGDLSVEMKRLEIRFFVNRKGLLQCPQLGAEVDPIQDIGTFHGLSSQIVLQSVPNKTIKSILVPIGEVHWRRSGIHVQVTIDNHGRYARYTVNGLLGRLDCPQEPLLLHLKAALHALTSFPIPDTLTGRTGTEEARHCLVSARIQPWTPLQGYSLDILSKLKSLSPRREYYPPEIRLYQKVKWDKHLTTTIQFEEFAVLVDRILQKSEMLKAFTTSAEGYGPVHFREVAMDQLTSRGYIRRQIYERSDPLSNSSVMSNVEHGVPYTPMDEGPTSEAGRQVYRTAKAIWSEIDGVPELSKLTPILEQCDLIGGFKGKSENLSVVSLLDANASHSWGCHVEMCRQAGSLKSFDGVFWLSLLAYGQHADMNVLPWLVAIYRDPRLREIEPPTHPTFIKFCASERPALDTMRDKILAIQHSYDEYRKPGGQQRTGKTPTITVYQETQRSEAAQIALHVVNEWPVVPRTENDFEVLIKTLQCEYIDIEATWAFLGPELERMSNNRDLCNYLRKLEGTADQLRREQSPEGNLEHGVLWASKPADITVAPGVHLQSTYITPELTGSLMTKSCEVVSSTTAHETSVGECLNGVTAQPITYGSESAIALSTLPDGLSTLNHIVQGFVSSPDTTRQQYGEDLHLSLVALIRDLKSPPRTKNTSHPSDLPVQIDEMVKNVYECGDNIRRSLAHDERAFQWLDVGNLWPCVSTVALLEQLRAKHVAKLDPGMKATLVQYGILITKLQRFLRMNNAALCQEKGQFSQQFSQEQQYEGHSNWVPLEYPEWLLLEIDNDILIRPSQIDVAKAIISPQSKSNSVLQMNMGQGKTSCIMPMAAATLANRTNLCRLIVPRALLLQTAQVMQSRIGGLVDRTLIHIPFARRSPTKSDALNLYRHIHEGVLATGGIMLCLPEHILSFKLSGLQQLMDNNVETGKRMVETQSWLDKSCRDILDESDFTLSAKTQLIYPSGTPTAIDGHPQRWQVIEELLLLVESHVAYLESTYPDGIKVLRRHQGYPIIHFLRKEVEDALTGLLVQDVCRGRLPQVQLKSSDADAQKDIETVISGIHVPPETWNSASEALRDDVFGWKILHLLRGLIHQGIILLCLKKRWNVQYGLHPDRAPLAVPFEAKGIPSSTAEYGHPDTALVLTCLAFYQTGLTRPQMTQTIVHVIRSDDPASQYERLVHGCTLPTNLQHWNLLNTDDDAQMEELWSCIRFDRSVLNYFLNNFAFPSHAKQFAVKLQASGWDIPLLSNDASQQNLTTGFSGTNDNKRMLPHTIEQHDLPSLLQTNAEVLGYLLELRNQECYQAVGRDGRQLTETKLLELLYKEKIRILIDAGAYILEMSNHDLAAAWLHAYPEAQGAVYFNQDSQVMVIARFQKDPMPLLASPFAENLHQCVVYIDQAHTRGTDLKLPLNATGAVTLGLGQTKDQTVQAAMRLRQLGSTQNIAFIAPPEVYQSILDLRPDTHTSDRSSAITSIDVVHWLLEQSCKANESMMSLHVAQGFDFCRRTNALWKNDKYLRDENDRKELLDVIKQQEDQTLEQLYGHKSSTAEPTTLDFPCLQGFAANLRQRQADLLIESGPAQASAFEEVEQEREVEFEVEQLREKQKPLHFVPLSFPGLDPFIVHFCVTGELEEHENFIQAFEFMGNTIIGQQFGVKKTPSRLFVSKEFSRTIHTRATIQKMTRPVEWILWSAKTQTALIIIPEEAELLMHSLRKGKRQGARLLTYAAPVTRSMQVFNTLRYFTLPSSKEELTFPAWLSIEIGVVAGRLYFDYDEYQDLLAWLGVEADAEQRALPQETNSVPEAQTSAVSRGIFVDEPLKFLLEWLTYCRKTLDIMHTPMGYLCQSRVLRRDHPFFASAMQLKEELGSLGSSSSGNNVPGVDDGSLDDDVDEI